MTIIIKKEDTLLTALDKVNKEVASRTKYGLRTEELPSKANAHRLVWSNNQAAWHTSNYIEHDILCPGDDKPMTHKEYVDKYLYRSSGRPDPKQCKVSISKTQQMDANELLVQGVTLKTLELLARLANDLPLYRGSFEAKQRGVFSLRGIDVPPGIAQIPLAQMDPTNLEALVDKVTGLIFESEN
jgi:hypothetical protein